MDRATRERQLLAAYDSLLDVPAPDRDAFITRSFSGDPELARDLARMLQAESAPAFMAQPAGDALGPLAADMERARPRPAQWREYYEELRVLGRGAMGKTFLARDRETGAHVCVKEIFSDVDRRMLRQEYRALSRLSHPNVMRVLAIEAQTEPPYLVSEYIDGVTIREHVRGLPTIDEAVIAGVMRPVADAVASLHASDIIHRDLKPENVLVDRSGDAARPVVIDLGLAVVDQYDHEWNLTASAPIVRGTPAYMAPEQFRGEVLTPACDVYALGVMLFELAMGRARHDTISEAFIRTGDSLRLDDSFWRPKWKRLKPLIARCTHPRIEKRPSAAEVRDALFSALSSRA